MKKVWVRKQGNVCTVFMDVASEKPLPLTAFDEEPPGFPVTMSVKEAEQRFAGKEIVWVTPPQEFAQTDLNNQDSDRAVVKAEVQKFLAEHKTPGTPHTPLQSTYSCNSACSAAALTVLKNYLNMQQTALSTAAKKHVPVLQAKLQAAKEILELLNE